MMDEGREKRALSTGNTSDL